MSDLLWDKKNVYSRVTMLDFWNLFCHTYEGSLRMAFDISPSVLEEVNCTFFSRVIGRSIYFCKPMGFRFSDMSGVACINPIRYFGSFLKNQINIV